MALQGYLGVDRGITYYNLVSDQFTDLNAMVVPGTLRDSLLILRLLLDQDTELEPAEIMTDTVAYANSVFGAARRSGRVFGQAR